MADTEEDLPAIIKTPNEIFEKFLLPLDPESLQKACRTHSKFADICNNEFFWKRKMKFDYPSILESNIVGGSYKETWKNIIFFVPKHGNIEMWKSLTLLIPEYENIETWKSLIPFISKYGRIETVEIPVTLVLSRKIGYDVDIVRTSKVNHNHSPDVVNNILDIYHDEGGEGFNHSDFCKYLKVYFKYLTEHFPYERDDLDRNYGDDYWEGEDGKGRIIANHVKELNYIYYRDDSNEDLDIDESSIFKVLDCNYNNNTGIMSIKMHIIKIGSHDRKPFKALC